MKMSDDLISRSALLKEINGDGNKRADTLMREWYADMVRRQPTAYDVDKVVERLEAEAEDCQNEANEPAQHGNYGAAATLEGIAKGYKYSANIVKSGGIE